MILCNLLCSFHSSFYLLSNSDKQRVVLLVWIIGLSFFLFPYKYTAQLCTGYPRKCLNRWTKHFSSFQGRKETWRLIIFFWGYYCHLCYKVKNLRPLSSRSCSLHVGSFWLSLISEDGDDCLRGFCIWLSTVTWEVPKFLWIWNWFSFKS